MSAVARLAEQVNRRTPVTPLHFTISSADARELMQVISDTCPEHGRCGLCGAATCVSCCIFCICEDLP